MYGEHFNPINERMLSKKGRKVLNKVKDIFDINFCGATVRKIELSSDEFDDLLEAVMSSFREDCKEVIPYKGRAIVRGKK